MSSSDDSDRRAESQDDLYFASPGCSVGVQQEPNQESL